MKVLDFGKDNNELPTIKISCTGEGFNHKGCGALLEITPLDIKTGTYQSYGETEQFLYIVCPVCNKKTEIFYSKIMNPDFRKLLL